MHDLIILGAGPAGLTAGIYAARGGLDAVIVEPKAVGGQAALTAEIENYPGFANVNGFELVSAMQSQCEALGVTFVYDAPAKLSLSGDVKRVTTAYSGVLEAKPSSSPQAPSPARWGSPARASLWARACPTAPPATEHSSAADPSPSWAGATPPWKTRFILKDSPPRCTSSTAATRCAPTPSLPNA